MPRKFTDHLDISSGEAEEQAQLRRFMRKCGDEEVSFSDEVWLSRSEQWMRRYCIVTENGLYLLPHPKSGAVEDDANTGSRLHLGNIIELTLPGGEGVKCVVQVRAKIGADTCPVFSLLFKEKTRAHQLCLAVSNTVHSVLVTDSSSSASPSPLPSTPALVHTPAPISPPRLSVLASLTKALERPPPQHAQGVLFRKVAPLPSTVQHQWRPVALVS
eukprot:TRINITY_DN17734_c0_g1_i1.p1 TRINITY_DN17734_c0_g1~~TRINITY_DN17734_c0_g1_i1.p1  ORF type:complete len:216 (+),score=21.92 TRINITY_DN17734_c0_g1_i1:66-713(+)